MNEEKKSVFILYWAIALPSIIVAVMVYERFNKEEEERENAASILNTKNK